MSLVSLQKAIKQVMNFYRRPLPPICISFSSEEGKVLFKEAMLKGQMENYFRLASQLRTQDEPAFCGLATLVMVLNALEIDPGRIWKGPWRWYHEDMLDCCIPLDVVKSKGITLDQFICISKCNGLTANVQRMSESPDFDDFKQILSRITTIDDEILVVSYSRQGLGQTGSGHFASVGGFHSSREMVLLFDTARFKYPPHWVPVGALWDAMKAVDEETGLPRGYVTLTKDIDSSCLLLLATSVALNEFAMMRGDAETGSFAALMERWQGFLCFDDVDAYNDECAAVTVRAAARMMVEEALAQVAPYSPFPLTCHGHFATAAIGSELGAAMSAIVREVVQCPIGTEVGKIISGLSSNELHRLSENVFIIPKLHGCTLLILQDSFVKVTFLLSCWLMVTAPIRNVPIEISGNPTRAQLLQKLTADIAFNNLSLQSRMELVQLSNKIAKMYSCHDRTSCCANWTCGTKCHS